MVNLEEPFDRLLTQGMVLKGGEVMSKSKGNIVDPDDIIKKCGADTLRLFILFAAPPEAELEWNDTGMDGAWRFLSRVWRLVKPLSKGRRETSAQEALAQADIAKKMHQTIKKVTSDMQGGFKFNTAISSIMELVNDLYKLPPQEQRSKTAVQAIEAIVILLSPFVPHICEEMWEMLGHKESIFKASWPTYDEQCLKEEEFTYVIQVNGKVRSKIVVPASATEEQIKESALADPKTREWIKDGAVRKVLFVPKKLVSIVVS